MTCHTEEHFSIHSPAELYALVVDIERYPEFLPWCKHTAILEKKPKMLLADMTINFKAFKEHFTSRVHLTPPKPKNKNSACGLDVEVIKGPFHHLNNRWQFVPECRDGTHGTNITFTIDFKFRSKLLDSMIGFVFEAAMRKMVSAFEKRADAIYGSSGE